MSDAVISYTDEDTGTVFRWHGGAYIDVGYLDLSEEGSVLVGTDYEPSFDALDVINVWDDENDRSYFEMDPRIMTGTRPFRLILEAFEARCAEYLAEVSQDA